MTSGVAVTGIGVIAPGGIGRTQFWDLLSTGRTATRKITAFDATDFRSKVAAEVDFEPLDHDITPREQRRMDRAAQFAVAATKEAVRHSGWQPESEHDPGRVGVSIGSAVGCTVSLEREYMVVSDSGREWEVDPRYSSPHNHQYLVPSSLAAEVAWEVGAEGPVQLISDGCTSGLDAVGHGARLITSGLADVVVAGATDAPISPISVACFDAIRATTACSPDDAASASRPFDLTRDGFVLGEGAAVLILESSEHARRRGAQIICHVAGFASRSNRFHMTGLRKDGVEMSAAIDLALRDAQRGGDDVDYVNAHGSGTKQNDRHETAAVKLSLADHATRTPMSSIKSMVGHSLGAIGAIELAACALAIDNQVVPPTANLHEPDPECDLDYVPLHARERSLRTVLSVGSGFGGFQSAVVLTAP